jgi:hypothetical protein
MQFACPIFSGLGDGFTDAGTQALDRKIDKLPQLDALVDALPAEAGADHFRFWQWERVSDQLIARRKKFGPMAVCLAGHSFGVWAAIKIAWRLNAHKIAVQYLAAIDPTALPGGLDPVPPNVETVDEFWSTSRFFNAPNSARRRKPDGSAGGKLVYGPRWSGARREPLVVKGGHIACASNPLVHARIIAGVRTVLDNID